MEHGLDFVQRYVKFFRNLLRRHSGFQIKKYRLDWHAGAFKHPCAADSPRNAFHRRALGPIEFSQFNPCWNPQSGIPAKRHGAEVRYRVSAGTEMSNFGDGLSIGYLYVQAIQFPFPLIGYGFSHLHHQVNSQSAYWPLR